MHGVPVSPSVLTWLSIHANPKSLGSGPCFAYADGVRHVLCNGDCALNFGWALFRLCPSPFFLFPTGSSCLEVLFDSIRTLVILLDFFVHTIITAEQVLTAHSQAWEIWKQHWSITATLCSWHLILGARQVDFFKQLLCFPQEPLIGCVCIILTWWDRE